MIRILIAGISPGKISPVELRGVAALPRISSSARGFSGYALRLLRGAWCWHVSIRLSMRSDQVVFVDAPPAVVKIASTLRRVKRLPAAVSCSGDQLTNTVDGARLAIKAAGKR